MQIRRLWMVTAAFGLAATSSLAQTGDPAFDGDYIASTGREDTSKADVLVKIPLGDSAADAEKKIDAFLAGLDRSVEWEQVSDTDLFVYIRYDFTVEK